MSDEDDSNSSPTSEDGLDLYDRDKLAPRFFGVLFFCSLAALTYLMGAFVHDIVLALVVVAMFRPLYHFVVRLVGGRGWLASGIVTLVIVLLVATPLALLTIAMVEQGQMAYTAVADSLGAGLSDKSALSVAIEQVQGALAKIGIQVSPERLDSLLHKAGEVMQAGAFAAGGSMLSNLAALLVHASVLLMIVFYLLVDADRLREFAFKLSPLPREDEELLVRKFSQVAKGTLIGNGIGSVAQGTLCGSAMWAAGLPSPLFGAAVMSVLAFLPLAGVSIVVLPLGAYLMFAESISTGVLFLGFCLGQAAIFENVVKTKLIGAGAAMHDLLAFMAILGGLSVFGILGLLYGPLLATAFLTLTDLYFERYRRTLALNFMGRSKAPGGP